jgi:hypothetical protein
MRLGAAGSRTANRARLLTPTQGERMPQLKCENCGLGWCSGAGVGAAPGLSGQLDPA